VVSNAVGAAHKAGGDPRTLTSTFEMLDRQVRQMSRLVDDLLDLSRVTRGKIELRKEWVEIGPIIEQAVEAARSQYGTLSQHLTVNLPTAPVQLVADPARLGQVIGNLLNNACKFTDPGGDITLTVEQKDEQVTIRVRDSGIGIAAEQIPHLFDMFAQVDTSIERTHDGLGIGLTLVKTLIEMHGGTVEARSAGLGQGSEFEVRLPLPVETQSPVPVSDKEGARHTPRRILVVDDNRDGADSLSLLLQLAGHETELQYDGPEAVDAAERWRPDVVLLDIGLPGLNGYEVCRRIRQQPWGKDMVVIALSGWGQAEDRRRSQEAGFNRHLVKPVDHDVLVDLLDRLPVPGVAA
jgi:CheY-like chemotaxis protein/two-component sensor histidine kinase